jgi:hypothetical protein
VKDASGLRADSVQIRGRIVPNTPGVRGYNMYMYKHIHVLITPRQHAFLRDEARRSGLPMNELVRRAIDTGLRPNAAFHVLGYEVRLGLFRRPDAATVGRGSRVV